MNKSNISTDLLAIFVANHPFDPTMRSRLDRKTARIANP